MHHGKKEGCLRDVKVGEVVLVGSDNANNLTWPLARVLELILGEYLRPVQKLYPLEVSEDNKILMTPNDEPCNVPLSRAVEAPAASEVSPQIQTRTGRLVRAPKRYNKRGC